LIVSAASTKQLGLNRSLFIMNSNYEGLCLRVA
jgi:hypothetical protein